MILRLIQLINNFYKDNSDKQNVNTESTDALGEYCAFGCYDAVHICEPVKYETTDKSKIWEEKNRSVLEEPGQECTTYTLACITKDDNADLLFWEKSKEMPFLFFSLLRMRRTPNGREKNPTQEMLENLAGNDNVMAYLTTEHSELAVFYITDNFAEGVNYMYTLNKEGSILKKYTIFATREDALDPYKDLHKQIDKSTRVECQLDGVVKNWDKIEGFISQLENQLELEKGSIKKRRLFGSKDISITIPEVCFKKLLCIYKMGGLLTHSNEEFKKAFFNIETQFFESKSVEDTREGGDGYAKP